MPISRTDQLFTLIKSLTKAEKRNFRLYVNRMQSGDKVKFVRLFDVLDKMSKYDEQFVSKKFKGQERGKFSNLKRHLYSQILISLRMIHIQKNVDMQIREQIDFARILYQKGLYLQSLALLQRTKKIAFVSHQDHLHLEIIEFEKMIQSRHITRSKDVEGIVTTLTDESFHRSTVIYNLTRLTNLKLVLHALYLNRGHVTRESHIKEVTRTFKRYAPKIRYEAMTFFEKVYYHQAKVWYYLTLQNSLYCYKHASNWVELFNSNPDMKDKDPSLYMRGLHYILISTYNLGYYRQFIKVLDEFEEFKEPQSMNLKTNARVLSFLYRYTSRLNRHFFEGTFEEGLYLPKRITQRIQRYRINLDTHRVMVFYYKIACLYIGCEMPGKAIDFLNKIIDLDVKHLREDIQVYSRLLFLVAHYDAGNFIFLDHQVIATERFLKRLTSISPVQEITLNFFKKVSKVAPDKRSLHVSKFLNNLLEIKNNQFEVRSFSYLDLTFWAKSKLEKKSMRHVIRRNFLNNLQPSGKLKSSIK